MRLVKFLTLCVAMSRNQGKFFIRKGRVSVDGKVTTDPDFELLDSSRVFFDGKQIAIIEHHYIVLNKPAHFACVTEDKEYPSVLNLIKDLAIDRSYYFANTLGPLETGLVLISSDIRWTSRLSLRLQKKSCIYRIISANDINEDQIKNLSEIWSASSANNMLDNIDIQKQNINTLLIRLNQEQSAKIMAALSSINLTIKQLQLQQIGKMGIGEIAEGDYLQVKENEVQI
ncbi:MAG: hypothetical protein CMK36_03635 [Porticoccaceae bacterium]|nr:hypothetical protein [Porticoccaceae bacterium]